ncbi:hypothetical protein [Actinoallomurus iriomotensis]|uniref:Uncharacterized protein n=1 Tax=Actinoallomurus iriomotensis TaxID=478107 RepID=A0A9W6SC29_9ACTN|nr:hypothetical protein [Actinoallomurus iriomotensis]GLY90853.1 hypothetical protein Airi02_087820 [Actinoallomurus iriomotensis]
MVIRVLRSRWRGAFAVVALVPWGLGLPLAAVAFVLDAVAGEGGPLELTVAVLGGAASAVTVPAQAQTVRALVSRPRLALGSEALVVHDAALLRRAARIRREIIAGAERLDGSAQAGYDTAELSPYREPLNVAILLAEEHIFTSARRRRGGTWIWLVPRRHERPPRFPEPGDRHRRIHMRAADPAAAVTAINDWVS